MPRPLAAASHEILHMRTRYSALLLRGTKQLYFHFKGLFSETISGQRYTVLDLKKEKKPTLIDATGSAVQLNGFFGKSFFFFNLFS